MAALEALVSVFRAPDAPHKETAFAQKVTHVWLWGASALDGSDVRSFSDRIGQAKSELNQMERGWLFPVFFIGLKLQL